MVEPQLADIGLLEEQKIEKRGKAPAGITVVHPELGVVDVGVATEPLDAPRLPQYDVVATAIRPPSFQVCPAPQNLVGVLDAPVVLFLELVRGRGGRRITPSPKGLDEATPLFQRFERKKNVSLSIGNDVVDILFEPETVLLPQAFEELLLASRDRGRRQANYQSPRGRRTRSFMSTS